MTIGEKIALRRRTAGLSQEALAAQLGVSRQAVSRWETDESLPDTEKIAQLCRIFGVSADDLLLDKPPETSASARPPLPLCRRLFWHVYLWMGAIGVLMALAGLIGAIFWALRTDQWYYDIGRIGTALLYHWMGPIAAGGGCLIMLALLLLVFDVLLSRLD
ncbi:helix-turn-helix transcriptional regulator [uncultured Oscillibacter sp.]|uniref:helix-turn-helix domain-containing protein n=1 Tax=uncultured Oscillibacter sp. TaxID=876091 RepID=UPI0026258F9D|nr:helix-turn-helix transcriptional regulator [uncultured Oscillibacter sp.]